MNTLQPLNLQNERAGGVHFISDVVKGTQMFEARCKACSVSVCECVCEKERKREKRGRKGRSWKEREKRKN